MRKHKKDPTHRLLTKGYQAALAGRTQRACPYMDGSASAFHWLSGWREARQDQWSGYNQLTLQQKLGNL